MTSLPSKFVILSQIYNAWALQTRCFPTSFPTPQLQRRSLEAGLKSAECVFDQGAQEVALKHLQSSYFRLDLTPVTKERKM